METIGVYSAYISSCSSWVRAFVFLHCSYHLKLSWGSMPLSGLPRLTWLGSHTDQLMHVFKGKKSTRLAAWWGRIQTKLVLGRCWQTKIIFGKSLTQTCLLILRKLLYDYLVLYCGVPGCPCTCILVVESVSRLLIMIIKVVVRVVCVLVKVLFAGDPTSLARDNISGYPIKKPH